MKKGCLIIFIISFVLGFIQEYPTVAKVFGAIVAILIVSIFIPSKFIYLVRKLLNPTLFFKKVKSNKIETESVNNASPLVATSIRTEQDVVKTTTIQAEKKIDMTDNIISKEEGKHTSQISETDTSKSSSNLILFDRIKNVIVTEKLDVFAINSRTFVNMLKDYNTFQTVEEQAYCKILEAAIANGVVEKILKWGMESLDGRKAIRLFVATFGFDETKATTIIAYVYYSYVNEEMPSIIEINQHSNDKPLLQQKTEVSISNKHTTSNKILEPYDPKRDLERYQYPSIDLLNKNNNESNLNIDLDEQNANKNHIVNVLNNFGIEAGSVKAIVGSTITFFEITPTNEFTISKIQKVKDDIAISLCAGTRIIAPIPGKGTIGIELPNSKANTAGLECLLNSEEFKETSMDLPCAIGKDISNDIFMFDLTTIPHILVAGATGQGKSMCLNAIIISLLYKKHPAEMKLVLIDPKKVEFGTYNSIANHFLAQLPNDDAESVITDSTKAVQTLNSLCKEMDTRYDLLNIAGARNIKDYNKKFCSRLLNPEKGHQYMPYIVVIIDDYDILTMTVGKEIEESIERITLLARTVGIHLVIATQQTTHSIISEKIKVNMQGRIAFKLMTTIDSKKNIDSPDAYQLIGNGDMLFLDKNALVRVQCAYIDTTEVERICQFISKQQGYVTPFDLPDMDIDYSYSLNSSDDVDMKNLDSLFEDAARLIVLNQQGSTSLIQRKFSIGYNRADRLMNQLEKAGIVGPAQGAKPREVLVQDERNLNTLLASLSN